MGAVQGFNPDMNGDGRISQKEFERMKKLGLDVSYMDRDGDGKIDSKFKADHNSVWVDDNEKRVYERAGSGHNTTYLMSHSIIKNPDGSTTIAPVDNIEVNDEELYKGIDLKY